MSKYFECVQPDSVLSEQERSRMAGTVCSTISTKLGKRRLVFLLLNHKICNLARRFSVAYKNETSILLSGAIGAIVPHR